MNAAGGFCDDLWLHKHSPERCWDRRPELEMHECTLGWRRWQFYIFLHTLNILFSAPILIDGCGYIQHWAAEMSPFAPLALWCGHRFEIENTLKIVDQHKHNSKQFVSFSSSPSCNETWSRFRSPADISRSRHIVNFLQFICLRQCLSQPWPRAHTGRHHKETTRDHTTVKVRARSGCHLYSPRTRREDRVKVWTFRRD